MTAGIYCIKNVVNGKQYIGSTVNFKRRWERHKKLLEENRHYSIHLQKSWNKYGKNSFIFEIIEKCEPIKELLLFKEQCWLDTLKVGYFDGILGGINHNISYNGSPTAGSPLGFKHTDETKKKVSIAGKGRVVSEKTKQKMREASYWKGKHLSEEIKKKISAGHLGEKSVNAVFTWLLVKEIREKYVTGLFSYQDLAKEYRVSLGAIEKVILNISWKDNNYFYKKLDYKKGERCNDLFRKKVSNKCRGENSNKAKLTWIKVREIREKWKTGNYNQKQLAEEYKVVKRTISSIVNNKSWVIDLEKS